MDQELAFSALSPTVTMAAKNAHGLMQCSECDRTFGPARAFAQRLEAGDRWGDPFVEDQVRKVREHYEARHVGKIDDSAPANFSAKV